MGWWLKLLAGVLAQLTLWRASKDDWSPLRIALVLSVILAMVIVAHKFFG
jgi:hypothetical protein